MSNECFMRLSLLDQLSSTQGQTIQRLQVALALLAVGAVFRHVLDGEPFVAALASGSGNTIAFLLAPRFLVLRSLRPLPVRRCTTARRRLLLLVLCLAVVCLAWEAPRSRLLAKLELRLEVRRCVRLTAGLCSRPGRRGRWQGHLLAKGLPGAPSKELNATSKELSISLKELNAISKELNA